MATPTTAYSGTARDPFAIDKVHRAMDAGWKRSEWNRKNSTFIAGEIAGKWYGKNHQRGDRGWETWRPRNLLDRLTMTYLAYLCPTEIKARLKSKVFGMETQAKLREYDLNHCIQECDLAAKHELVVMDALISGRGWYEVGLTAGVRIADIRGERQDIGYEYVKAVSWDDRLTDPWSRDPEEDTMRAARRIVSKAWLEEIRETASGATLAMIEKMLDVAPIKRPGGEDSEQAELEGDQQMDVGCFDQIELWRVVFYQGDRVYEGLCTHWDEGDEWIVEPSEFQGPEGGPFIDLDFCRLPNARTPVSHFSQLLDLHLSQAELSAKLTNDILESKDAYVYRDDAARQLAMDLRDTKHHWAVKGDPTGISKMTVGEHIPSNVEGMQLIDGWSQEQSVSIGQTSGAKGGSETATGDMILNQNAMTVLGRFRNRSFESLKQVMRQLRWYRDTNPEPRNYTHKLQGGLEVELVYDDVTKEGDFADFTEDVQPWAPAQYDPALERAQTLEMYGAIQSHVLPLAMAGFPLDKMLSQIGDAFQKPEMAELAPTPETMMQAQMLTQGLQPPQPGQPVPQGGGGVPNATQTAPSPVDERQSAVSGAVPAGV